MKEVLLCCLQHIGFPMAMLSLENLRKTRTVVVGDDAGV